MTPKTPKTPTAEQRADGFALELAPQVPQCGVQPGQPPPQVGAREFVLALGYQIDQPVNVATVATNHQPSISRPCRRPMTNRITPAAASGISGHHSNLGRIPERRLVEDAAVSTLHL